MNGKFIHLNVITRPVLAVSSDEFFTEVDGVEQFLTSHVLIGLNVSFDPFLSLSLGIFGAEKLVRATGFSFAAWSEVVTEDSLLGNVILLKQPTNQCDAGGFLRGCHGISFGAHVLDADAIRVGSFAMVRPLVIFDHLDDLTTAADNVVGGNLAFAIGIGKEFDGFL
jgi:hypothetical protein